MLIKLLLLLIISGCTFSFKDKQIESGVIDTPVTIDDTIKIDVEEMTPLEEVKKQMELRLLELKTEY
tara:strand:+ start:414 stop:614 length:201 start_codon:yes stop_codon:yes gene_type:complete